jgi:hypothetical protein
MSQSRVAREVLVLARERVHIVRLPCLLRGAFLV